MRDAINADQSVMQKPDEYEYVDADEQNQPEPTEAAREKAEEVKSQMEAMKARRAGAAKVDENDGEAKEDLFNEK